MKDRREIREISIEDEIEKQGEQIEREVQADESVRGVKMPPELDARIKASIAEIEAQTERDNAAEAKRLRKFPKKKKTWIALVAVLVLLLAIGTTSVGSKSYLKEMWDKRFGNNNVDITSVADMESSETKEIDEATVYHEIKDTLGFDAVRLRKLPSKMYCEKYEIDENAGIAKVFYTYQGETVQYKIYMNNKDSSYSKHPVDELVDTFSVSNDTQSIDVEEYFIKATNETRYYAVFQYKDAEYQLKGIMDRDKFEEILINLKYF